MHEETANAATPRERMGAAMKRGKEISNCLPEEGETRSRTGRRLKKCRKRGKQMKKLSEGKRRENASSSFTAKKKERGDDQPEREGKKRGSLRWLESLPIGMGGKETASRRPEEERDLSMSGRRNSVSQSAAFRGKGKRGWPLSREKRADNKVEGIEINRNHPIKRTDASYK